MFDLNFPRANSFAISRGRIKAQVEHFYVEELFEPELSLEGEHVWLFIEKKGQNTEYVAKQLARFAGVRSMDVGYSGLKDRWAQTRQWFSIYLGNRPEPQWGSFELDGVEIIKHARHQKKLRKGEHFGNRFKLLVSDLQASQDLEKGLELIKERGFPNYFGVQRFGRDAANLVRGEKFFKGELKASRSQRGFYLSAARSYLYNLNLAKAIATGEWLEDGKSGPMYGDPQPEVDPISEAEEQVFSSYPVLVEGLHKNRLKLERRAYCIRPAHFTWEREQNQISLSFDLPTGCFATALLDEVFSIETAEAGSDQS